MKSNLSLQGILSLILVSLFVTTAYSAVPPPTTDVFNGERGISFNNNWKFYLGDAENANAVDFKDDNWRKLSVPHDWSIELPFNQKSLAGGSAAYLDGGIGWYRKTFTLDKSYTGKQVSIQFEGIFMNSEVWINGHYLGKRPFGYGTFQYDLTPYINIGDQSNVIAVKADNNQPTGRWYSGSGIYRNVWITATHPVHVAYCGSFVTTPYIDETKAEIQVETRVQNQYEKARKVKLKTTIYNQEGKEVVSNTSAISDFPAGTDKNVSNKLVIENPQRWELTNPYLYTVITEVIVKGKAVDSFKSDLGIRTFRYDEKSGFWMNGKSMDINGVCMHHDLGAIGAAQNYRALERQLEILRSYGVNAIRTSHNPPAPELLEMCNRMGFLVMVETFDVWEKGKNTNDYQLYFNEWAEQDLQDVIRRDRNHPCVFMWCIGNEIPQQSTDRGYEIGKQLVEWIHNDDSTRPITQAFNARSKIPSVLDVVGHNYASGKDYDAKKSGHPEYIRVGTESSSALRTRGVYHMPSTYSTRWADMQCSSYDNSVVWWGHTGEESWDIDRTRKFVIGQFIWTGFDYLGEPYPYGWPARSSYFGVVDMCGFPKDIYYFYQSQWTEKPMVHLLPHWNWLEGDTIPVWAYSNCDSISLSVNGEAISTKTVSKIKPYHNEWNIPFTPGKVKALAYKDGKIVAQDSIVTSGNPDAISLQVGRDEIRADGKDMIFVETDILDKNGNFVNNAENQIVYTVSGPGMVVGVDNGNPLSTELLKGSTIKAFNGKSLAMIQSNGNMGTIKVTASTKPMPVNLAHHKAANASSEYTKDFNNYAIKKPTETDVQTKKHVSSRGNDNNAITRWEAVDNKPGHWWMLDLESVQPVTGIQVDWVGARAYKYFVETSKDKINWEKVVDKTQNNVTGKISIDSFEATARYIRITITSTGSDAPAAFTEFKVFNGSTTNLPQQNIAARGNDGDVFTAWVANDNKKDQSWQVDLGLELDITGSEIVWQKPGTNFKYVIETSIDSKNWRTVADKSDNIGTSHYVADKYKALARYVKVTILGDKNSDEKAGFAEFRVFNGSNTEVKSATIAVDCK